MIILALSLLHQKSIAMETQNQSFSIKLIYWGTQITFWLFCASLLVGVFLSVGFIYGFIRPDNLAVGVPVGLDLAQNGLLQIDGHDIAVRFVEMQGRMRFSDGTPQFIGRIYGVFMLLAIALFFYVFYTFKNFIGTIYKGDFFNKRNIGLLKRIAYAVAFGWVFMLVYSYFQYFFIVQRLDYPVLDSAADLQFYPAVLLAALFIWVLSHVFVKGVELQENNDLTI